MLVNVLYFVLLGIDKQHFTRRARNKMSISRIAPCGLICDICLGFQREKNKCFGCTEEGNILSHAKCSILNCPEKSGEPAKPCSICPKYPCKRLKNLEKRYSTNYGESLVDNFQQIKEKGQDQFLIEAEKVWNCPDCGKLLTVHRPQCSNCMSPNSHYKRKSR
jgi:hypothetical protein